MYESSILPLLSPQAHMKSVHNMARARLISHVGPTLQMRNLTLEIKINYSLSSPAGHCYASLTEPLLGEMFQDQSGMIPTFHGLRGAAGAGSKSTIKR